ncbi:MAG: hypothetical protein K9M99_05705 [Candidatus Cloacimonetes bacterium]|nr:hypothetical protein [Candidatus Cloacimonadota bacterium]
MYKYDDYLDKDDLMKLLGWEDSYHQAIHFPEQVLQAYRINTNVLSALPNPQHISIWQAAGENDLLIQLLSIIFQDKLEISALTELPEEWQSECGLLFIPDFRQQLLKIPDAPGVIYLSNGKRGQSFLNASFFDFQPIPANEGLGIFLGFISRYLDDLFGYDHSSIIYKIIASGMQKAGVVAWRHPLKNNFAKSWAVKLSQLKFCRFSSSLPELTVLCHYWQNKMQTWAAIIPGDDKQIYLERMSSAGKLPARPAETEIIFADGDDLLNQIISLHYLVNAIAIYTAIIKQIKYKEDIYEL